MALGAYDISHSADAGPSPGVPPAPVPGAAGAASPGASTPARNQGPASKSGTPASPIQMPYSVPVRVAVPRIGIDAALIEVGLNADGTVGVPPITDALEAAWFDGGPAPGQNGPAVIDGHVDSLDVPGHRAAFYRLGDARPGDRIRVTRADGRDAVFTVDAVELDLKKDFPSARVYGPLDYPALRLITCGGGFQPGRGYVGNVIVYAHLTGRR